MPVFLQKRAVCRQDRVKALFPSPSDEMRKRGMQHRLAEPMKIQKFDLAAKRIGQAFKLRIGKHPCRAPCAVAKGAAKVADIRNFKIYFAKSHDRRISFAVK
jgi:hypothetical protein